MVRDLGLPVKFIGVGERIDDLRDFDPETFVDALLGNDPAKAELLREKAQKMMRLSSDGGGANLMSLAPSKSEGDASSRLRASFGANASGPISTSKAAVKSKRNPSPKPTPRKKK